MNEGAERQRKDEALDDRSTRARIRDAALKQFAEFGVKGATIRGIASEAGVSPGAVQRHFPTKEALREACDEHVLATIHRLQDLGRRERGVTDPTVVAGVNQLVQPITRYLAMALTSGSPTAATWFDELFDLYHEVLTGGEIGPALPESEDTRAIVAVFTAMQLGLTVMYDHVLRVLGTRAGEPEALVRLGRARLFLLPDQIISEEIIARVRLGLDYYEQVYGQAGRSTTTSPQEHEDD